MYKKIKKDILEARKSGDKIKTNLLNTLIGDAQKEAINSGNREPDDKIVNKLIKKYLKNTKETLGLKNKQGMDISQEKDEKEILESYLPKQLTEAELEKIVSELVDQLPEKNKKFMGQIMKSLKQKYDGAFDGKTASSIVGKKLS
ncbi:MAG: GatB/YqeY domain-containing protein [Candidatus Muiribacteriota bacterium]